VATEILNISCAKSVTGPRNLFAFVILVRVHLVTVSKKVCPCINHVLYTYVCNSKPYIIPQPKSDASLSCIGLKPYTELVSKQYISPCIVSRVITILHRNSVLSLKTSCYSRLYTSISLRFLPSSENTKKKVLQSHHNFVVLHSFLFS
jgi:hypothetical protein